MPELLRNADKALTLEAHIPPYQAPMRHDALQLRSLVTVWALNLAILALECTR
jgi:hypothetical protein